MGNFLQELKRRNVIKSGIAYLVVAWLLIQIASIIFPTFEFPEYVFKVLIYVLAFGLVIWIGFSWVYDWTSGGWQRTAVLPAGYEAKPPGKRSVLLFSIFVILLCLGGWYFGRLISTQPKQVVMSLAVLPFANLSDQPEQEAFVSGLQDNLISSLSQINSLRVIGRTSTLRYTKTIKSMKEIATELEVDALIETSVFKVGDSVRINIQLIQVFPAERHLWASTFDRPVDHNLLAMFNELTQSVVNEIHLKLSPEETSLLAVSNQVDPDALKAYLKGKYQLEKLSPEGFHMALNLFEEAIEIDPGFAPVYAELANSYMYMLQMRMVGYNEALPKIYKYNNKALELNPDLPEANFTMALIKWFEWDWPVCEQKYKEFLKKNPNHALANAFYGHLLMLQKKGKEALTFVNKAVELDPLNDLILSLRAVVLLSNGMLEEAYELFGRSMKLNPRSILTLRGKEGSSYASDDLQNSIEFLETIYRDIYQLDLDLKQIYEIEGYETALLYLCERIGKEMKAQDFYLALYYHRLGRNEKSIEWLLQAFDNHDGDIPYLSAFHGLENVINDPRIIASFEKVGLPN